MPWIFSFLAADKNNFKLGRSRGRLGDEKEVIPEGQRWPGAHRAGKPGKKSHSLLFFRDLSALATVAGRSCAFLKPADASIFLLARPTILTGTRERRSLPATSLTYARTHLFLFVLAAWMYILQKVDVALHSKSIAIFRFRFRTQGFVPFRDILSLFSLFMLK